VKVTVLPTGTANLASVLAALRRAGARPVVRLDPKAARVVLPGVGAFVEPLQELRGRAEPTLAICLGMQMLFEGSAENEAVLGLGLFPGRVERFGEDVRVPHLGWNRVVAEPECRLLRSGHFYFAHAYRAVDAPGPRATCDYGGRFVAALERGPLLACQFHPELSGRTGHELIGRWLRC